VALRASPGWTPSLGLPKGLKIKSQIKAKAKAKAKARSKDRSLRQLPHGIECFQLEIGRRQAAIAGKPAPQLYSCTPMRRSRPTQHDER
jgi:hypothetical protein